MGSLIREQKSAATIFRWIIFSAILVLLPAVNAALPRYLIVTKEHTTDTTFNAIIQLVNRGQGIVSNIPGSIVRSYSAALNDEQANIAKHHPSVDLLLSVYPGSSNQVLGRRDNIPVRRSADTPLCIQNNSFPTPQKRADTPFKFGNYHIRQEQQPNQLFHLKFLSNSPIGVSDIEEPVEQYLFDPTLGTGSTIYIIDDGIDFTNEVSRRLTLAANWKLNASRNSRIFSPGSFDTIYLQMSLQTGQIMNTSL